ASRCPRETACPRRAGVSATRAADRACAGRRALASGLLRQRCHLLHRRGGSHTAATVPAMTTVRVRRRTLPAFVHTPPWEQACDYEALPLDAIDCLFDSASIAMHDTIAGYAHPSFPPGGPRPE